MKIIHKVTLIVDHGNSLSCGLLAAEEIPGSREINNAIVNDPNWEPSPSGGAFQFERPMRGNLRLVPGPAAIAAGVPRDATIVVDGGKYVVFEWSCEHE